MRKPNILNLRAYFMYLGLCKKIYSLGPKYMKFVGLNTTFFCMGPKGCYKRQKSVNLQILHLLLPFSFML